MSLNKLPSSTVKLICSAQVITSVATVVKELMENSLDAGATSIEVKLENYGLDRIEVKDNGSGVKRDDVWVMCMKSYTSKITSFSDLNKLSSFGFRGEALNALCAVSNVSVTTITEADTIAMSYEFDHNGNVLTSKMSHIIKGTSVVAENLFKNLPVRKQFITTGRRKTEELKKVEMVVKCLSVIHPKVRVAFTHNKFCIWQKNCVPNVKVSFSMIVAPTIVKQLIDIRHSSEKGSFLFLVPRKGCNISSTCYGNPGEAVYLFINRRPVKDKKIEKIVQDEIINYFGPEIPAGKYPTCLISITLPPDSLDVNIEPNKTKVIVAEMDVIGSIIKNKLSEYYVEAFQSPNDFLNAIDEEVKNVEAKRKNEEGNVELMVKKPKMSQEDVQPKDDPLGSYQNNNTQKDDLNSHVSEDVSVLKDLLSDDFPEIETTIMNGIDGEKSDVDRVKNEFDREKNEVDESKNEIERETNDVDREKNVETFLNGLFSDEDDLDIDKQNTPTQDNVPTIPTKSPNESEGKYKSIFFPDKIPEESNIEKSEKTSLTDISSFTLSQWSRGQINLDGTNVNSSTAVVGIKEVREEESQVIINIDPITKAPVNEEINSQASEISFKNPLVSDGLGGCPEDTGSQECERSVSSQMGCKDMAGFTKFASEMTNKISENSNGLSFGKVANELATKWRQLQDSEKQVYNEKAKHKHKVKEDKANASMRERLQKFLAKSNEKRVPKKRDYWKTIDADLSISSLRKALERRVSKEKKTELESIGSLSEDVKCAVEGACLYLYSDSRLQESLMFYNNLARMIIPFKVLESNIKITQEVLGDTLWSVLVSLETAIHVQSGAVIISDNRITSNGLRIELVKDPAGCYYQITDVPLHIAFFGLDDLKEILNLIYLSSPDLPLEKCRPLKVVSYIRAETIRFITKNEITPGKDNGPEKLKFWLTSIKDLFRSCPHQNSVYKKINLNDFIK